MPIRQIDGTPFSYYLIAFDEQGLERREPDGSLLSETVMTRLRDRKQPVSDVFITSHGWKGDLAAAIVQYDKWVAAMASQDEDIRRARVRYRGFAPLVIGLHWPSLPWGVETLPASSAGTLTLDETAVADGIAKDVADNEISRAAIDTLLKSVASARSATLTSAMHDAYIALHEASRLAANGFNGRPGADQEGFDPDAIVQEAQRLPASNGDDSRLLGARADTIREALLSPLRQLSFWRMKDRARTFGETGAHELLATMQKTAPRARFYLMGHSFGCIVVSAMLAGPRNARKPRIIRPVRSMFLVQGALSLWSYGDRIPYAPGSDGYFHRILADERVSGPLITTRSSHDAAVGRYYPLGAGVMRQKLLGESYPEYGGIGTFGIQGSDNIRDMPMMPCEHAYDFSGERVFNLDASDIIKNGDGPSGAHSDIAHPEVAHAFWAAVLGEPASSGERVLGWGAPGSGKIALEPVEVDDTRGGVLGGRRGAAPAASALEAGAAPERWLNIEFEGRDPTAPLIKQQWYQLAFDIDVIARSSAAAATGLNEASLFPEGVDEVTLTVQIETSDFDLSGPVSQLQVARSGRSHTKARFDVSPLRDGPCSMRVTLLKEGNFVQQMDITFNVGKGRSSKVKPIIRGRPLAAVSMIRPRVVGLRIKPGVAGYDCTVWGVVSAEARLPITAAYLQSAVDAARDALMKVVTMQNGRKLEFQSEIDISPAISKQALQTMARAGANLFARLFEAPGAGPDSIAIGAFLRKLASNRETPLKIQILAEHLPIPWGMLYVGEVREGSVLDWENFLGMRHIIEQIPLGANLSVYDTTIASDDPELTVSVNLNNLIDEKMQVDYVAQQRAFWQETGLAIVDRDTRSDLIKALNNDDTRDQILYFYCHATSRGLNEAGGPDASSLELGDKVITLEEFRLDAPVSTQLRRNPLVFINACESAEMSPMFYDGFVPYFMSKGARGVIGTECQVPAFFAMEWAKRFFELFLYGESLGETVLKLRREFWLEHNNPLGLLYAVHCNADTAVVPALSSAKRRGGSRLASV